MPLFDLEDYFMTYKEKRSIRRAYFIMCVILTIIFAVFVVDSIIEENLYNNAVGLVKNGEYETALEFFKKIDSEIRDQSELESYAEARIAYEEGNAVLAIANLSEIPSNYDGELCDEIRQFKSYIKNRWD